jgi:ferredoxin
VTGRVVTVVVDPARCQGHGRCAAVAPDVFTLDDDTGHCAITELTIPAALADQAQLAADNCPERAITVSSGA